MAQHTNRIRKATSAILSTAMVAALIPSAALAQKGKDTAASDYSPVASYRVEANSTFRVNLNLCSSPTIVDARGDGDTDVDYRIFDPNGTEVFSNYAYDDIATATLYPNVSNGNCALYHMDMINRGNVWNQVQVTVGNSTANGDAPSVGTYRVEANSEHWVDLTLCHRRARLEAHGDGDTDVDYTLYDRNNRVIHQDLELHDRTDVTFSTGSNDGTCYPFRLKLNNLGSVWNQVTVTLYDLD